MTTLSLSLLGPFAATFNGRALTHFRSNRAQALLIYLAAERAYPHPREALMELLWPGLPQKSAQVNLRQTLYQLRQLTNNEETAATVETTVPLLLTDRHTAQLHPDVALELDVDHFSHLLQGNPGQEQLEDAATLYRGDFLCDFYLPDSAPFEEWAAARRADLRQQALDALDNLTALLMQQAAYEEARAYALRQLEIDNLHEHGHRQLMEILARLGQRSQALAQYEALRQLLQTELGAEPSPKTQALYEQIQRAEVGTAVHLTRRVRGYHLHEEIGAGAFGVVYRAVQPVVGREVAIKIIAPDYANQPDFIRRFEAEARIIARLEHPHIVPLYDYWREPDGAFLVMRWLRGGNLGTRLQKEPCDLETAVRILDQLSAALSIAHRRGIVHRDIKPANILLDEMGNAYLTDFGIAKNLESDLALTMENAIVGSPQYISPEQLRQEPVSPQTDIYSLGLVLYELLTGQPPFADETVVALLARHLNDPLPLAHERQPTLPAAVDGVIQRATAKRPADRFPDMTAFKEALHAALAAPTPAPEIPPPAPITLSKHNLPSHPTPFVGREQELSDLQALLARPETRLVTIIGPGGMGKTRLALAVGRRLLEHGNRFPDGVFFVPLAALQQSDEIVSKIAQSVNLPGESETGRSPTQQLLDFLRAKQMLLILDNFEHLLEGVALLSEMLATAPKLQLLATSRERLQLYEEQVYTIEGLAYPEETAVSTPDSLMGYTAVQLFLDHTQRIAPGYTLTDRDAPHLTRLCQLVAGTPLALELAASWMDSVPLPDIVAEIQQSLDFLETDLRNIPERHRSMRAVFDSTWQRLSKDEQTVLAQLSVFRGGFTLAAATEVAQANRRIMARLTRQSLVGFEGENGRYTMHELLRQYATSQLAKQSDADLIPQVQGRHARYYCQLLHQYQDEVLKPHGLPPLDADVENFGDAWNFALANRQDTLLLQAMFTLAIYHVIRGQMKEGKRKFRTAVELVRHDWPNLDAAPTTTQHLLGGLLAWQSRFSQDLSLTNKPGPTLAEQSYVILQALNEKGIETYRETTAVMHMLVIEALNANQYEDAQALAEQFLAFCKGKDAFGMQNALLDLGTIAYYTGAYAPAEKWFERAISHCHQYGTIITDAHIHAWMAKLAAIKGDFAREEHLLRSAIARYENLDSVAYVAVITGDLAASLMHQGRFADAEPLFTESISRLTYYGLLKSARERKSWLALLHLAQGAHDQARSLAQAYPVDAQVSATAHAIQAIIALSTKQTTDGIYHLQEALKNVQVHQGSHTLFWMLPAAALYLATCGHIERAIMIYSLAKQMPYVAHSQWFAIVVGKPLTSAAGTLPPDTIQAAEKKGREMDPRQTAVSLLKEIQTTKE